MRVGKETLMVQEHGGVHVMPDQLRQVFNDSEEEVLWLIFDAPDDEILPAQGGDPKDFYPTDPTELPPELEGYEWPPGSDSV